MKLFIFCSFMAVLLVSNGCIFARPKNGPPTVKEVADMLETVTNGMPYDQIPYIKEALPKDFRHVSVWSVDVDVTEDPIDDKSIVLYRQVPAGILMHVTESDYRLAPPIVEAEGDNYMGGIAVFFDSEKKFKGYFAWSDFKRFKDSEIRFEMEKQQFIERES